MTESFEARPIHGLPICDRIRLLVRQSSDSAMIVGYLFSIPVVLSYAVEPGTVELRTMTRADAVVILRNLA